MTLVFIKSYCERPMLREISQSTKAETRMKTCSTLHIPPNTQTPCTHMKLREP